MCRNYFYKQFYDTSRPGSLGHYYIHRVFIKELNNFRNLLLCVFLKAVM